MNLEINVKIPFGLHASSIKRKTYLFFRWQKAGRKVKNAIFHFYVLPQEDNQTFWREKNHHFFVEEYFLDFLA